MKRKKCVTAGRKKKKIGIATSLAVILCIGMAFGYIRFAKGYQTFIPPEHESAAMAGAPAAADTYQTLPVKEGYVVGIDTMPVYRDGGLHLNVANEEGNTVWFLVRVYQDDKKIAQTGILHPGEYIGEVECNKKLAAGASVMVQTVAFEPETYHSEGVARITCEVAGE